MEAAAEAEAGLSEAGDESPLSGAAASDEPEIGTGDSYMLEAGDLGTYSSETLSVAVYFHFLDLKCNQILKIHHLCEA